MGWKKFRDKIANAVEDFHDITKYIDPIGHYSLDAAHDTSTHLVGETSHLIGKLGGDSFIGDAGKHWEQMAEKDQEDFGRWLTNTGLSVAAIWGAGAAGNALAGGEGVGTAAGAAGEGSLSGTGIIGTDVMAGAGTAAGDAAAAQAAAAAAAGGTEAAAAVGGAGAAGGAFGASGVPWAGGVDAGAPGLGYAEAGGGFVGNGAGGSAGSFFGEGAGAGSGLLSQAGDYLKDNWQPLLKAVMGNQTATGGSGGSSGSGGGGNLAQMNLVSNALRNRDTTLPQMYDQNYHARS